MSENLAPHGPFKISMEVSIAGEEGRGTVTYDLPPGEIPTAESIREGMEECERILADTDFRLLDRHEFCNLLIEEKTGVSERFAIPGKNEWNWPDD